MRAAVAESVDVFVLGAGPTGMAVSLLLQKKRPDLTVAVADMRTEPLRIQILNSYSDSDQRLFELMGVEGVYSGGSYQIKDVERKMRRQIASVSSNAGSRLRQFIPYKVVSIDRDERVATLQSCEHEAETVKVGFRYIVLADGAKRKGLQMLGEDLSTTHELSDVQPCFEHVGLVELQCRGKRVYPGDIAVVPVSNRKEALQRLAYLPDPDDDTIQVAAWSRPYLPKAYCNVHGKRLNKLKLNCELPMCIIEEREPKRKRALLIAWAKRLLSVIQTNQARVDPASFILSQLFGIRLDGLAGSAPGQIFDDADFTELHASHKHDAAKKAQLRVLSTTVRRDRIKRLVTKLPKAGDKTGAMIAMGDVAALPYFPNANGSRVAMAVAELFTSALDEDGNFDADTFARLAARELIKTDISAQQSIARDLLTISEWLEKKRLDLVSATQDVVLSWPAYKATVLKQMMALIDPIDHEVERRFPLAFSGIDAVAYKTLDPRAVEMVLETTEYLDSGPASFVTCLARHVSTADDLGGSELATTFHGFYHASIREIQYKVNRRLNRETPLTREAYDFIIEALRVGGVSVTPQRYFRFVMLSRSLDAQNSILVALLADLRPEHNQVLLADLADREDISPAFYEAIKHHFNALDGHVQTGCWHGMMTMALVRDDLTCVAELLASAQVSAPLSKTRILEAYQLVCKCGTAGAMKLVAGCEGFNRAIPKTRMWMGLADIAARSGAPSPDTVTAPLDLRP